MVIPEKAPFFNLEMHLSPKLPEVLSVGMALQRRLVDSGWASMRSRAQQHRVEEQAKACGIRDSGKARTPRTCFMPFMGHWTLASISRQVATCTHVDKWSPSQGSRPQSRE